ncbi:hypothetical protein LR48_Vigan635s012500 [Vigna angularis]|uniref:Uncharacterized protein n=2 Tax=Phaseolus angularis TaxID=3914 RepID=A0A0L9TEY9_PHAAN|nr:hypothetical protein LR48_Vigan635s012500 [Vigna angularis]BAT80294.1 hypothetical protein VIGAN_02329200 [Vigna angularis var. angularis]
MASSQEQLRKIALEGFDLVEKLYGRRCSSSAEGIWVVRQLPDEEVEKPPVKTIEVANYAMAAAYPRAKPYNNRWGRPIVF